MNRFIPKWERDPFQPDRFVAVAPGGVMLEARSDWWRVGQDTKAEGYAHYGLTLISGKGKSHSRCKAAATRAYNDLVREGIIIAWMVPDANASLEVKA